MSHYRDLWPFLIGQMNYDDPPECLNTSQCREVIINAQVPLEWALPLYGYAMPFIVALTLLTNSFIVLVLSQRYLRTPTNYVLLAMAVTELLTGLSCLPWLLYYYTFNGYRTDIQYGLSQLWCFSFPYMATICPSIFHTAAIWLTVYLAAQRYIYICMPKMVRNHCTIHRSKQAIVAICVCSLSIYAPEFFATYNGSYTLYNPKFNGNRRICLRIRTKFIQTVGNDIYYYSLYGLHTLLSHTLPCILLVCFTWKLISAISVADRRHAFLVARTATRKYTIESSETLELDPEKRKGFKLKSRESFSESKRLQGLKQNTRMLIAVIILFLVTEIPAALIFSVHVSAVAFQINFIQRHYNILNKLLIIRNVLIVMSYPFRFAIYCGMSQQFREVVRILLTHRIFFPCSKRAHEILRSMHHGPHARLLQNNLPGGTNTLNEPTQFSDDRKYPYDLQLEEWNQSRMASPRSSFLNVQSEVLMKVIQTTTPRFLLNGSD
ncbi:unnamed protein product [Bursaphelenchus xylophilus]|uniref:(pine wood nematode) hypothetical protein n=1 Tax=Bursaphelenchus xylophilus TaxID=6326 RepID=A0A7I8WJF2_BURXY|nr:unnamed protein product [Bursaphelenchus xylophilus]CAG9108047.1 unnamed protein product [Bursaphelenchus xylophilus]